MVRITIFTRSSSGKKNIKVRLRLTEGRRVDLYHKTDIRADRDALAKFGVNCILKDGVRNFDQDLRDALSREVSYMQRAFETMKCKGLDIAGQVFEQQIDELKNPTAQIRSDAPRLTERFRQYIESAERDNIVGNSRLRHLSVVCSRMERYLSIRGLSLMTAAEFDQDTLMDFRMFIFDEYKFVDNHKHLYNDIPAQYLPRKRLSGNTVVGQMKMLHSFFADLVNRGEIARSPFQRLGLERRKVVMKIKLDDPVFLRRDEWTRLFACKIPSSLEPVREAFLLQTALGCRIGDFQKLTMDNIGVSDDNIAYVHYLPHKTAGAQSTNTEVVTPLVRFAFDIIRKTEFRLPILKNVYGKNGYNAQLKKLLTTCGIERKVPIYDEQRQQNTYVPVCCIASSKLARKTHIDLMNKVQIDMYAAGLHKIGSEAVKRYTALELKDRFAIINLAFGQPQYRCDSSLNLLE